MKALACVASMALVAAHTTTAYAIDARYQCSGGTRVIASFSEPGSVNARVSLKFQRGSRVVLPQVMSADGGRYADNYTEFWVKGERARLTRGGHTETCSTM